MGRDAYKSKHASSVSISGVIDTGVNSNGVRPMTNCKEKTLDTILRFVYDSRGEDNE